MHPSSPELPPEVCRLIAKLVVVTPRSMHLYAQPICHARHWLTHLPKAAASCEPSALKLPESLQLKPPAFELERFRARMRTKDATLAHGIGQLWKWVEQDGALERPMALLDEMHGPQWLDGDFALAACVYHGSYFSRLSPSIRQTPYLFAHAIDSIGQDVARGDDETATFERTAVVRTLLPNLLALAVPIAPHSAALDEQLQAMLLL